MRAPLGKHLSAPEVSHGTSGTNKPRRNTRPRSGFGASSFFEARPAQVVGSHLRNKLGPWPELVSATNVGPARYKRIAGDGRGTSRRGKPQFIVRKAVWTDAILGEP